MSSSNVGQVSIDLILNSQEFNNKLNSKFKEIENTSQKTCNKISSTFGKMGKLVAGAFAVGAITKFSKECLDLGSNLQEVQNVVDSTFTTLNDKVNEYAQTSITQLGMSETAYKRYIGTMGAMSKSFGFTEEEALKMSKTLTELTGDVASFYNLSHDESYTKLKSVFTGETESLKELGVVMTQAALDSFALANGYGKTTAAMSEQEKVALRYAFVQDKLRTASGDFIRTQNGWANQTRILVQQFNALKASIGQGLINALTPVIKMMNLLLTKINAVAKGFASLTAKIFGDASSSGSQAAGAISSAVEDIGTTAGGASDSISDMGDSTAAAAKKAEKALMGFDEINKLNPQDDGASGAGDVGSVGDTGFGDETSQAIEDATKKESIFEKTLNRIIEKMKQLKDLFVDGFKFGLDATNFEDSLDKIKNSLSRIKELFKEIFDSDVLFSFDSMLNTISESLGKIIGSVVGTGVALAAGLIDGFRKYLDENKSFLNEKLIEIFSNIGEAFDYLANIFTTIGEILSNAFKSEAFSTIVSNVMSILINPLIAGFSLLCEVIRDILKVISDYLDEHKEEIQYIVDTILIKVAEATTKIKENVDILCRKIKEFYEEYIQPNLGDIITLVLKMTAAFLAAKVIIGVIAKITTTITTISTVLTTLKSSLSIVTIGTKLFGTAFSALCSPIGIVVAAIVGVIAVVTLMYTKFESTREAVNSLFENLKIAFENFKDGFMTLFNSLRESYESYVKPIIDLLIEKVKECVENTIVPLINKTIEFIGKLIEQISVIWKEWLAPLLGWIVDKILSTIAPIVEKLINIAFGLFEGVGIVIQGIMDTLTGIIDFIIGVFSGDWERAWNGIKSTFEGIWNIIKGFVVSIWNTIKAIFSSQIQEIKTNFENKMNSIKTFFTNCLNGIKSSASTILNDIKGIFSSVWSSITSFFSSKIDGMKDKAISGFTAIKDGASRIFNSLKDLVSNIFSGLVGIIKAPINAAISLINKAISGLNSLSFDLPEVLGGDHIGFNIPQIPALAQGGYVKANQPQLAIIGDNRTQGEIVSPEDKMADVFSSVLDKYFGNLLSNNNNNGDNQPINIYVQMDGKTIYKEMKNINNKEFNRQGSRQFN